MKKSTAKPEAPVKNIVTGEHLEQFEQCVGYWQSVLGLSDWRIAVSSVRAKNAMAEVAKFNLEQRSAKLRLGSDWSETVVDDRSISETALHEVLHIFLYELKQFCKDENFTEEDELSAEHRVINILEKLLSNASPLGPRT